MVKRPIFPGVTTAFSEASVDGDGEQLLQRVASEAGSHAARSAEAEQGS